MTHNITAPDFTRHAVEHVVYQPGQTVVTKGPYPVRYVVRHEVANFRGERHIVAVGGRWVPLGIIERPL
jgi:hypothetical protein